MSRTVTSARSRRAAAALALSLSAGLGLGACGVFGGDAPEPVASIDAVTGDTTQVTLDKGFVKALGQLGLQPGTVGDGKLVKGALRFPITGGNVTVFEPGEVSPYVIGQLQHEGSGFSLAAGGTTVRITNLNVDPGVSRVYGDVSVNGKQAAAERLHLPARRAHAEAAGERCAHRHAGGHRGEGVAGRRQAAQLDLQDQGGQARAPGRHREDHRRHQVRRLTARRTTGSLRSRGGGTQ